MTTFYCYQVIFKFCAKLIELQLIGPFFVISTFVQSVLVISGAVLDQEQGDLDQKIRIISGFYTLITLNINNHFKLKFIAILILHPILLIHMNVISNLDLQVRYQINLS